MEPWFNIRPYIWGYCYVKLFSRKSAFTFFPRVTNDLFLTFYFHRIELLQDGPIEIRTVF